MPSLLTMWSTRSKKVSVKKFYQKQKAVVQGWKEDEEHLNADCESRRKEIEEKEQKNKVWDTRLAMVTIVINVLLICAKMFAAVYSHSISILASVVDSAMDVTSGFVLWLACRMMEKSSKHHYPVGMNRLEPLAVVVVGLFMIFANAIVIQESITHTISGNIHSIVDLSTLIILCSGTAIKAVLFVVCRSRSSAASRVLAIDQRNDCITNIVALAGAYIGNRWWKYADPLGGFLVSGFIVLTWLGTVREQIPLLIGKSADPEFIHRILYLAVKHDDRILHIDTLYVYHFGANFLVELHVVMDRGLRLDDSHDVAELLQVKLERLPFVERAFVHCDYEFDGDEHV